MGLVYTNPWFSIEFHKNQMKSLLVSRHSGLKRNPHLYIDHYFEPKSTRSSMNKITCVIFSLLKMGIYSNIRMCSFMWGYVCVYVAYKYSSRSKILVILSDTDELRFSERYISETKKDLNYKCNNYSNYSNLACIRP